MALNDLAYAPEVAAAMLKKQQACVAGSLPGGERRCCFGTQTVAHRHRSGLFHVVYSTAWRRRRGLFWGAGSGDGLGWSPRGRPHNGRKRRLLERLTVTRGDKQRLFSWCDRYALIEARKLIVTGAVTIAKDAVRLLEDDGDQGLQLTTDQKVKIVTNLLTVTCAESDTTPTVNLS